MMMRMKTTTTIISFVLSYYLAAYDKLNYNPKL